ncbi:MAG: NAD-dependent epimerase/dehydratase family protein [Betaproteobacteria bacterium]
MVLGAVRGRVVVTGAGGFIGRAVIPTLIARGFDVRGLVRDDAPSLGDAEVRVVGDLTQMNQSALTGMLNEANAVVHLAARVHVPARTDAQAAYRALNVDVTERLARAAAACGIAHFVFASSVKVHGEATTRGHPFRETDTPHPHDAYARSKWEAETALAQVAAATGMRVTTLRLPLTYGTGAKANFAALARAIRRGIPLPLAGIDNRRSLLGTGNLADALATVLADADTRDRSRCTTFLLADARPVSTPGLARAIGQAVGTPARLFALPPRLLRMMATVLGRDDLLARLMGSLEVDASAFGKRFGWSPPVTLEQGLAAALASPSPL